MAVSALVGSWSQFNNLLGSTSVEHVTSRLVFLKLHCASKSPGVLLKWRFWVNWSYMELRICISNKFPRDADDASLWTMNSKIH